MAVPVGDVEGQRQVVGAAVGLSFCQVKYLKTRPASYDSAALLLFRKIAHCVCLLSSLLLYICFRLDFLNLPRQGSVKLLACSMSCWLQGVGLRWPGVMLWRSRKSTGRKAPIPQLLCMEIELTVLLLMSVGFGEQRLFVLQSELGPERCLWSASNTPAHRKCLWM